MTHSHTLRGTASVRACAAGGWPALCCLPMQPLELPPCLRTHRPRCWLSLLQTVGPSPPPRTAFVREATPPKILSNLREASPPPPRPAPPKEVIPERPALPQEILPKLPVKSSKKAEPYYAVPVSPPRPVTPPIQTPKADNRYKLLVLFDESIFVFKISKEK